LAFTAGASLQPQLFSPPQLRTTRQPLRTTTQDLQELRCSEYSLRVLPADRGDGLHGRSGGASMDQRGRFRRDVHYEAESGSGGGEGVRGDLPGNGGGRSGGVVAR
jgi:hypothetical protein